MSSSLRFPVAHAVRAAYVARGVAVENVDQFAQRIAPGRALEVDGVRWSVSATEALGCVVLLATHAAEHGELLRVRAEVPRRGRTLDDDGLADEAEHELREEIAVAIEGVVATAARVRAANGSPDPESARLHEIERRARRLVAALYEDDNPRRIAIEEMRVALGLPRR